MKREEIIDKYSDYLKSMVGLSLSLSECRDFVADIADALHQKEQEGMSAEKYMFIWMDKKYGGSKDVGNWTPEDVMEFANDYAASRISDKIPTEEEIEELICDWSAGTWDNLGTLRADEVDVKGLAKAILSQLNK